MRPRAAQAQAGAPGLEFALQTLHGGLPVVCVHVLGVQECLTLVQLGLLSCKLPLRRLQLAVSLCRLLAMAGFERSSLRVHGFQLGGQLGYFALETLHAQCLSEIRPACMHRHASLPHICHQPTVLARIGATNVANCMRHSHKRKGLPKS